MGLDAMILVFWKLSFKLAFPLSSFTLIKRLFSSSLLSAIGMVTSAYLRLLVFLLAILIPTCESSSLAFHMMYYAYKLNKQGDNIQPWHTPFPSWNQFIPCLVLIVAPWSTAFWTLFVNYEGYFISSKVFLPTVVDIMLIWIKSAHSHLFLLIPKILMFTLAISCLTISNLPWFMDLTFQVPMQ